MTAELTGTGAALVRQICATPDDDTPRLAFADWCEEAGDHERAEYIRSAIELARCGPPHKQPSYPEIPMPVTALGGRCLRFGYNDPCSLAVGDRIDLLVHRPGRKPKMLRGLRVYRLVPRPDLAPGEGDVYAVRDRDSGPWKGAVLARRCETLLDAHEWDWYNASRSLRDGGGAVLKANYSNASWSTGAEAEWSRGFVFRVATTHEILTHNKGGWCGLLCSEWPVTEVVAVGRVPHDISGGHRERCGWYHPEQGVAHGSAGAALIEREVWELLEDYDPDVGWTGRVYDSFESAAAALSKAFVKYGRKKAGLPLSW
jgi:uncharacterized protein (TIGR02996 family)